MELTTGMQIVNKNNPEWGTFTVLNKYDDRIWEIRGRGGVRTLMEDEIKFWKQS